MTTVVSFLPFFDGEGWGRQQKGSESCPWSLLRVVKSKGLVRSRHLYKDFVKIFFCVFGSVTLQYNYSAHSDLPPLKKINKWALMNLTAEHLLVKCWNFSKSSIFSQCSMTTVQFSRSVVSNSETPWTTARQASLSITNSRSLPKLMSIELLMPSNHLILCHPLLLLPSIFPSIRVFSNESALHIRWPKDWSFSFIKAYLMIFF